MSEDHSVTTQEITPGPDSSSLKNESNTNDLNKIKTEMDSISNQYRELQTLILTNEDSVNNSITDLLNSLKTISYNQSVLENKLDDALKNQMNTDVLVNNINSRLNKLSSLVNETDFVNSNVTSSHIHNNHNSTTNGGLNHSSSSYSSSRRGPGRPRKDTANYSSPNLQDYNSNSSAGNSLEPVNISLPTGSVQLSKSKRYFIDPINDSPLPSKPSSSSNLENAARRKRRGRPPKKRTVDTVIMSKDGSNSYISNSSTNGGVDIEMYPSDYEDDESKRDIDDEDDEEEEDDDDDLDDDADDADYKESVKNSSNKESLHIIHSNQSASSTNDDSNMEITRTQRELDKLRDPREKMLVNMKYNDRDKAKSFMRSNQKLLIAMKEEERRRRMTAVIYDIDDGNSKYSGTNHNNAATYNENENQQRTFQIPILQTPNGNNDKNHDDGKINNAESNTNIDINAEVNTTHDSGIPGTPFSNPRHQDIKPVLSQSVDISQPKKVGISSILNSDDSSPNKETSLNSAAINATHPVMKIESKDKRKRSKTDISMLENDEGNDDKSSIDINISGTRQLRKKRLVSTSASSPPLTAASMTGVISTVRPGNDSMVTHDSNISAKTSNDTVGSTSDYKTTLLLGSPIELLCKDGFFYQRAVPDVPITTGAYLEFKFKSKEEELLRGLPAGSEGRHDRNNAHFFKPNIERETETAFNILSATTLTEKYVNSLEYFLMEFRWENKLVGLGLKLRESKRTWQRRKALFALFEFWRDQSIEKRNFKNFTILHAVKEMENYRLFINRSVSWFYNHITLLKMILYDLCDKVDSQWRDWMFPRGAELPMLGVYSSEMGTKIDVNNINGAIDNLLVFDFLDDGSRNRQIKSSRIRAPKPGALSIVGVGNDGVSISSVPTLITLPGTKLSGSSSTNRGSGSLHTLVPSTRASRPSP